MIDVADLRRSYTQGGLEESDLTEHPIDLFEKWLKQAIDSQIYDPNGVVVSTVDENNQPYSRMVLLKDYDRENLIFYTNLGSRKAQHIKNNPKVCLLFPWYMLERQVMFIGEAVRQSTVQDLKYFHSRPRGSQIGAWASNQSHLISARGILESKFLEMKEKFKNGEIPLPSFWGGYKVKFNKVEFWQGRENRLHDRFIYELKDNVWQKPVRLAP
ncbi:pyridoxamine 5'-phosphate oxidase [Succinivibrio dextrinosolvens]|uniref:Pyridoxine/pyridoxamine 5'-phosphate oxidase n=1 Tax=Succinivibrio dextrinosolvens DSM 3072 TaxID=1123324 RepID=A0A1T4VW56_9GAMM|nr:pyridoxamine 5'-phosphate oxidase [Succinivibrio dextrinosolvens]MBE6422452.1 pyridoxamine 5'-phosphate oxidase [Succinivibrio dextrinosolvens]SKA69139.1 Pyridoxamine 5'-phosphate oxidase [Succinivibrio dextrinosolvens DSM 3072]